MAIAAAYRAAADECRRVADSRVEHFGDKFPADPATVAALLETAALIEAADSFEARAVQLEAPSSSPKPPQVKP